MKRIKVVNFPEFVTDDIIDFSRTDGFSSSEGLVHLGRPGMRARDISLGTGAPDFTPVVGELGGTMIRCGRVLTDAITFQRLNPPPGRKYYPDLAKLASDGRFWEALDTVTEKDLPACGHPVPVPGLGRVSSWDHEDEGGNVVYTALHIYPNADRLDIPANLLQLWARVVAGGELSPEGGFQPWNQPTWAAKQRELASARPPYADFPFPGLTTDPNVRNLVRVKQLRHGTERDKYLKEWHRLSGRTRPDLGPDTWRTPEVAPKPEPKK